MADFLSSVTSTDAHWQVSIEVVVLPNLLEAQACVRLSFRERDQKVVKRRNSRS